MNIFEDIKKGILPDENIVFYLYQNKIVDNDNKEEIEKYINILSNSFETANTEERILLNRVLFILEILKGEKEALNNFLYRALRLNMHEVGIEYVEFFNRVIDLFENEELFEVLKNKINVVDKLKKEELRSFFNWILHKIWNIPKFHNYNKFTNFYEALKKLLIRLRDSNRIDEMMYVEFFTYHIMGNNFQNIEEWREFNKNVTQETIKAYEQFISQLPTPNPTKKEKKRIAFIKDRIVFNSPFQVEYSLFKMLMQNKEFTDNYELIVYSFNQFEKSEDDIQLINNLERIGIKVKKPVDYFKEEGYYHNYLEKAIKFRDSLIKDNIDVIILGTNNFPIINFLTVVRTAPLQIYYSHANCAYDVPNIDKRISHFKQECKEFKWELIPIEVIPEFLVGSEGEKLVADIIKQDYKNKFGKDLVILGTIGRLVKIDNDEYIKAIAEIMKDNPNTIYLACGSGNEKNIKDKIKKYGIDENRFIFTGYIKSHVYGWIIDVWPETFPLKQGQSRNEFEAKGGAIIGYKKYFSHGSANNIIKFSKDLGIDDVPLAENIEQFISLTTKAIKDEEYRKKLGEMYKKIRNKPKFNFGKFQKVIDEN